MKDFIIVGGMCNASKKYLFDDLVHGKIHINAKKIGQTAGNKIDFLVYKGGTDHCIFCLWYSNILKNVKRIFTLKEYSPEIYHKYIGTEIVNVDFIKEIPDYPGIMGVPISIIVYPQDQFEIIGKATNTTIEVDGKRINKFERILIKKK